ncbi:MAG: CBS domain-containing protein [Gemmatimonadaceae bacterium]|nr:CBS domain-containing protein [Gemmatimonadaceae bacterium]
MHTVRTLLDRKGHAVVSVGPQATVLEAAHIMADNGLGAVLVVEGAETLGIFTERDVLRRIVALGVDPARTLVAAVMTTELVTCLPDTTLDECGAIMTSRRIRHLPVVDAQGVHGLISSGDVLAHRAAEQEATIKYLNDYMFYTRG